MKNSELNLKELLLAVLHRWKLIFVCMLLFAVLVAAATTYQQERRKSELQERYENELETYTVSLTAKQTAIRQNTEIIETTTRLIEESMLMAVDPYQKQTASMTLGIEVDVESLQLDVSGDKAASLVDYGNGTITRLASRYLIFANNVNLAELFKDILVGEHAERYLREVVIISRFMDDASKNPEGLSTTDIFTISVIDTPDLDAKAAVHLLYEYLLGKKPVLESTVSAHDLTVIDESYISTVDTALAAFQFAQHDKLAQASAQIILLRSEIDEMSANRPKQPLLWPNAVRNGVIGLVLGLVVGLMLAFFIYLTRYTLQYALQPKEKLGVAYLGGVAPAGGFFITNLKNRIAGDHLLKNEKEAIEVAGANIRLLAGDHQHILLTGQLPEADLSRAADELSEALKDTGLRVSSGANLGNDARTVSLFSQADAVILVERLQKSSIKQMQSDMELVKQNGKKLLGYLVY